MGVNLVGAVPLQAELDCFVECTSAKIALKAVIKIDFRIDQIAGLFELARGLESLDEVVFDGL